MNARNFCSFRAHGVFGRHTLENSRRSEVLKPKRAGHIDCALRYASGERFVIRWNTFVKWL
jgi:hypothetical protein